MTTESRWARAAVAHVESRCDGEPLDRSLRLTLNFHPDRTANGVHILDSMADGGLYRSQFETGTSNGGLTAHPSGDRWLWENALFGGAYDDAPGSERPKYGALDLWRGPLGGAPRFGSAFVRLKEHLLDRATFCFPDSWLDPVDFGTARRFALAPLATAYRAWALADPEGENTDPLDGYVEAQIHGRIVLAEDAEALVLDPCFRGTEVETKALSLGVPLEWHEGRVLTLATLDAHEEYRGPEPVRIGHEIARDGAIDAATIGEAATSGAYPIQPVKQLWHLTAQWGVPRA